MKLSNDHDGMNTFTPTEAAAGGGGSVFRLVIVSAASTGRRRLYKVLNTLIGTDGAPVLADASLVSIGALAEAGCTRI